MSKNSTITSWLACNNGAHDHGHDENPRVDPVLNNGASPVVWPSCARGVGLRTYGGLYGGAGVEVIDLTGEEEGEDDGVGGGEGKGGGSFFPGERGRDGRRGGGGIEHDQ